MLRYLERKYPKRKRLIEWTDFLLDAFWVILVLLLLFNVKNYCSPEIICGDCYEPIEIKWEQLESAKFTIINFSEKEPTDIVEIIDFDEINNECYEYINYN